MSDINTLRSHPTKLLLTHVQGVRNNTKKLTNSRLAELVAIFHDLGKINPNFQDKLDTDKTLKGYANHSYLSAYTFFCAFGCSRQNMEALKQFLGVDSFSQNDLIALTVSIAKHHGNLPDFSPKCRENEAFASILSKDENSALYQFLNQEKYLPVYDFINHFIRIDDFRQFLTNQNVQRGYSEQLVFKGDNDKSALDFFLDNQFAFACVMQADKADAQEIGTVIDDQLEAIQTFSKCINPQVDSFLGTLNQNSELNKLRTTIRNHAVRNIKDGLRNDEHVYELTAPTGSGKTLMMLSLASEIVKGKGAKRIIYSLPFLSITEQVEAEILKIFKGNEAFIQRIDSKSENHRFDKIQAELDGNPTEENILEANILEFQENTFAYPFVITTFVRFFESLLSNRNSELLKLPNFSKCIFLLDEIQALPPRLYGFFVAYLRKFCEKFDSYAIISTATQPNFCLPSNNSVATRFFCDYQNPKKLLPESYFEDPLFNRYRIEFSKEPIELGTLKEQVLSESQSALVILNTIDDTKELYKLLKEELSSEEVLLLNTHFTPRHRKLKIYIAKRRLRQNKRVIVVSTQLIEAGVDIDFPVLYRDFATVASIVQSAGRCNRNGKLGTLGSVKLFKLINKGKIRSDIIYSNGNDSEILRFTKEALLSVDYQEKDLIEVQKQFFNKIQSELLWAKHSQKNPKIEFDFLKDIKECQYDKIGRFQLIDKHLFGEEIQFYVKRNKKDQMFDQLLDLIAQLRILFRHRADFNSIKHVKRRYSNLLTRMSNQTAQIRIHPNLKQNIESRFRVCGELYELNPSDYSFELGININESFEIL